MSLSGSVFAQGTIAADNINGTGGTHATSFGRFFEVHGEPYSATPMNVTILGGPDANSLTPFVTLRGASALIPAGGGIFIDPSNGSYPVPGVAPGQPATLQLLAWRGNAPDFASSGFLDQFWPWNGSSYQNPTTFTFSNPTGGSTPSSLDGMPGMFMVLDTPEPSVMTLLGFGVAMLMIFNRQQNIDL